MPSVDVTPLRSPRTIFGRYRTNNGQILILAVDGYDVNDSLRKWQPTRARHSILPHSGRVLKSDWPDLNAGAYWAMLGINWREVALVTLAVVFVFGSVIGGLYLPGPYRDTLLDVWHAATILVIAFLIVRWLIRRKRRN